MNWYLQNGKDSDVVISSRVRLARNIAKYLVIGIGINNSQIIFND